MDDQFLERNLALLSKHFPPSLREEISTVSVNLDISIVSSKSGQPSLLLKREGKEIPLHSLYDPRKESVKYIQSLDEPDALVIAGAGIGYLIEEALVLYPDVPIFWVEKDSYLIKVALSSRLWKEVLSSDRLNILFRDSYQMLPAIFRQLNLKNIVTIVPPSAKILDEKFYSALEAAIAQFHQQKRINKATINKFEKLWIKNTLANSLSFLYNPGVQQLKGLGKGNHAIIIAAGPSLSKQLALISRITRDFIIIAVDTVFSVLLNHGIVPDFVVAVDPQEVNVKYFNSVANYSGCTLVLTPTVSRKIQRGYKEKILYFSSSFKVTDWLESFSNKKGDLDVGGSVVTVAFSLAVLLKVDTIAFVGLDLAYSEDLTHVKGTFFEESWFTTSSRLNSPLTIREKTYKKTHYIQRLGYKGITVNTDQKFLVFLDWLEKKIVNYDVKAYDCTEGGITKQHLEEMSLSIYVSTYQRSIDKGIFSSNDILKPDLKGFSDSLLRFNIELEKIKKGLQNGITLIKRFHQLKKGIDDLPKLNKELEKVDNRIKNQPAVLNYFLTLTSQKAIQEIDNAEDIDEGRVNKGFSGLAKTEMLYEALYESVVFISHWLSKAYRNVQKGLSPE